MATQSSDPKANIDSDLLSDTIIPCHSLRAMFLRHAPMGIQYGERESSQRRLGDLMILVGALNAAIGRGRDNSARGAVS